MPQTARRADYFEVAAEIVAPVRPARIWRCCECKAETRLADLNNDMLCASCGEPEEDPEDVIDLSDVAMVREHGSWSI